MSLELAGVSVGDLSPGAASLSVMRHAMRHSQLEDEGLDATTAAGRIGRRQGQPLPEAIREKMERAFGHDFSHVRIHLDGGAADAADALSAVAFAIGHDIYFNRSAWRPGTREGDELLAHELTHVVQADEGRIPQSSGGMEVSRPNDPHEREAERMGRQVVRELGRTSAEPAADSQHATTGTESGQHAAPESATQGPVGLPGPASQDGALEAVSAETAPAVEPAGPQAAVAAASPEGALISRDSGGFWSWLGYSDEEESSSSSSSSQTTSNGTSQSSGSQSVDESPAPGQQDAPPARIVFAGQVIQVDRGEGPDVTPTVTTELNREVIPGVTLRTARVNYDEAENVESGTVTADIHLGEVIHATGVELQITQGGQVSSMVTGIPIRIGEGIEGTVNLRFLPEGVFGGGNIGFEQLPLPAALGIEAGRLRIEVAPEQGVTGSGTVTGQIEGIGSTSIDLAFDGTALSGAAGIELAVPLEVVPHVQLTQGSLSGEWRQGVAELPLHGIIGVDVHGWLAGQISARYTVGTGLWNLNGELSRAAEFQFGELSAVTALMRLSVVDNAVTAAHVDIDWTAPRLEGTLGATYDFETRQVTGTGTARQTEDLVKTADWGSFTLKEGGNLTCEVTANELTRLEGVVSFEAQMNGPEGPVRVDGRVRGEMEPETGDMTGEVNGVLLDEVRIAGAGEETLHILEDAVLRATLAGTTLSEVTLDAGVRYNRDGAPLLTGTVTGASYVPTTGMLGFEGDLVLERDIERQSDDGEWTVRLVEGSHITCTVAESALTHLGGDMTLEVDDAQGPLLAGTITGATLELEELLASGNIELTTARDFLHPRATEGVMEGTAWILKVLTGSGVSGQMVDNDLRQVGAQLNMQVDDEQGALAGIDLEAEWSLEDDTVDGEGTLELLREIPIAENIGGMGWSARIVPGAEATGHIVNNDFKRVTGNMHGVINDGEADLIDVRGQGRWNTNTGDTDLSGSGALRRNKVLEVPGGGPWEAVLQRGTRLDVEMANEDIEELSGRLKARIDRDGEGFIQTDLEGTWTPGESVSGSGEAELLVETSLGTVGDYALAVEKGTGARVEIEEGRFTELSGEIPLRLDEGGESFIRAKLDGKYEVDERVVDGNGRASILRMKELGTLGDDTLFLLRGSGATITVRDNELTELGGTIKLSARDESEYAKINLEGSFDVQGDAGLTGSGGVEVTREKQLYAEGDYSFWLIPGTGATAHITESELTRIDGSVPFEVRDAEGSLIRGSVSGDYSAETGKVNGQGDVRLGRDLEYNLGGGAVMKFLAGSGGDAEVKDSRLEKLGGTLRAELWTDGQAQVRVEADGEYNVVTNTLETLEGSAQMLRPFELLGGAIEVRDVSGTAKIENNELVEAEGQGTIVIGELNNMQGDFEVAWSTIGGQDTYEGSGTLDFTLFNDPANGRSMEGEVSATYRSDDTFEVSGQATYNLNETLREISVDVEMDQELDPVINVDADLETVLVEPSNLFSMETDLLPRTEVPVYGPLGVYFGLKGGMALDMNALNARGHIAVADWRPVSELSQVPTFRTDLEMDWGLDYTAQLVPYIGVQADLQVASVGAGIRGLAELSADLDVNPSGSIWGGDGIFGGELAVGVRLAPEITLAMTPYVEAQVTGLGAWDKDLGELSQEVGNIMPFEWGGTYEFGDAPGPKTPGNHYDEGRANQSNRNVSAEDTSIESGGRSNTPGGPDFESSDEIANQQQDGEKTELQQLLDTIRNIQEIGKGLEALGFLTGLVLDIITATLTLGPLGFVAMIVWKAFKGELNWERIKGAVDDLVTALQACMELLQDYLPEWFQKVKDLFTGDRPSLWDALFGADDRMRDAVREGYHREAPLEMMVEMVDTMAGGWLSDADADCIAQVFEEAASRGMLRQVLAASEYDPDDFIDGWTTGFDDSRIKRVFRSNGIDW